MTDPQSPIVDALQRLLAAEHACVFGYPAIGTQLQDGDQVAHARADEAAHRLTRDSLAAQLVALGATPVAANASYPPPAKLDSAAAAQRWAVALEEQVASACLQLLVSSVQAGRTTLPAGTTEPALRRQGLTGLTASAETATFWRARATPDRPTVPFPGVS